ncbi:4Fe-4S dicluster domain-containing protein [Desulfofundulus thermobenzoicus]|uniref:4Fe-4S dicluster domain-containing protein n=1 Tax=Desulfofundulus thermobenzoicus TaxID=29376 RepID=UPI001A9B4093
MPILDEAEQCIGCLKCVKACPQNAIISRRDLKKRIYHLLFLTIGIGEATVMTIGTLIGLVSCPTHSKCLIS